LGGFDTDMYECQTYLSRGPMNEHCRRLATGEAMPSDLMLVGDVGGTHSRFATIAVTEAPWAVSHRLELTTDFPDLPAALRAYLDRSGLDRIPECAVIAAAGPVTAGKVNLTNRALEIRAADLLHFGFERAKLINDFAALAFAADRLGANDLHTIGPSVEGLPGQPISVIGPGTGLGVSCLVHESGRAIALATEGGKMAKSKRPPTLTPAGFRGSFPDAHADKEHPHRRRSH